MKKTLLGLMLSVSLLAGMAVTANADTTPKTSTGQVGFEKGSITIDTQDDGTDTNVANLDFGSDNVIDSKTDTFNNGNDKAKISVSDLRGDPTGWSLGVAQAAKFETSDKDELKGAAITLVSTYSTDSSNSGADAPTLAKAGKLELNPGEGSTPFMTATKGQGNGASIANISGSTLFVPTSSARLAGKTYSTTLTWDLNDTPSNS